MKNPNLTKGPWELMKFLNDDESVASITIDTGDEAIKVIASLYNEDLYEGELEANAKAIVTAVNNTYHKGIDPEGVPDMKEALINARKELITAHKIIGNSCIKDSQLEIEEALSKAGVTINEKAE